MAEEDEYEIDEVSISDAPDLEEIESVADDVSELTETAPEQTLADYQKTMKKAQIHDKIQKGIINRLNIHSGCC